MSKRQVDMYTLPLDPENDPRLEPGYHFDENGNIVDKEGNIYDQEYNLIKEAPNQGLALARKQFPKRTDKENSELAQIYQRQLDQKKEKKKT